MTEVPAPQRPLWGLLYSYNSYFCHVFCFSLLFSIFYPDGHPHFEFLMGFIIIFLYNFY